MNYTINDLKTGRVQLELLPNDSQDLHLLNLILKEAFPKNISCTGSSRYYFGIHSLEWGCTDFEKNNMPIQSVNEFYNYNLQNYQQEN